MNGVVQSELMTITLTGRVPGDLGSDPQGDLVKICTKPLGGTSDLEDHSFARTFASFWLKVYEKIEYHQIHPQVCGYPSNRTSFCHHYMSSHCLLY